RLARVAGAEDDSFHLLAAQAFRALLAHHPRDGVGDVALAASVGADNRGHPLVEGQLGPVGKRFEAVDFKPFEAHDTHHGAVAGASRGFRMWLLGNSWTTGPIGDPSPSG